MVIECIQMYPKANVADFLLITLPANSELRSRPLDLIADTVATNVARILSFTELVARGFTKACCAETTDAIVAHF